MQLSKEKKAIYKKKQIQLRKTITWYNLREID